MLGSTLPVREDRQAHTTEVPKPTGRQPGKTGKSRKHIGKTMGDTESCDTEAAGVILNRPEHEGSTPSRVTKQGQMQARTCGSPKT